MKILLTNDDGIDSPGLWSLAKAMSQIGETLIVAPDKQQSGTGASVSLRNSMSILELPSTIHGVRAYAIGGTPNDCMIAGLCQLAQGQVDLVVSGINLGANLGNDILYSGTVMATLPGYFRKIPAIALSLVIQDHEEEYHFDAATKIAQFLALGVKSGKMSTDAILNTNIPNIPLEQIKGITVTRAASCGFVQLTEVNHSSNLSYSNGTYDTSKLECEEGTDVWAVTKRLISITPLHPDVTAHTLIPSLTEHITGMETILFNKTSQI